MGQSVIKASPDQINEMKEFYKANLTSKVPPGGVFCAKTAGCTITAYRSGKVLFQGATHAAEAERWGEISPAKKTPDKRKASGIPLPAHISGMSVIGSDEVGKGDYFGPLVVVAVFADQKHLPLLKELGVKDSKHLKDEQIISIAKDLLTFIPYSLLKLDNPKYNEMQKKGMTQGKITALMHNQAISHLLRKMAPQKPEAILIDQFAEAPVYFRHLQGQQNIVKERVFFSTKAESIHLAVAAASILARYGFLRAFDKLSSKAGFKLPKGAGPLVDQAAARLIHEHGEKAIEDYTKVHFANTGKAMKIASRNKR